jgi:tripartite-type tricarboxylate transporter receptor subunit TctC
MKRRSLAALPLLAFPLIARTQTQQFPDRPLRIIAPFPPGSATDIWARAIGQRLQARLEQPVVVENRTGAAGQIGTDAAAKAPADGYTLLIGTPVNAIHERLYPKLPYDFSRDFAPVVHLAVYPLVLVVGPQSKANTLENLIEEARAAPNSVTFGSSGSGSSAHLAGEMLAIQTRTRMTHIPYKGTPAVYNDLIGGNVTMLFDNVTVARPQVAGGKVRALVVASPRRSRALPDVPSAAERGLPDLQASSWVTVFTRRGTPEPVISRLNTEINGILADLAFREQFEQQGAEIMGGTPDRLRQFFEGEVQRWGKVIEITGVKPE